MEQEIRNAVGLGSPELVIESFPKPEPEPEPKPKPTVTIYDFGRLLTENEPSVKKK